jgi:hypothetical protein
MRGFSVGITDGEFVMYGSEAGNLELAYNDQF